MYRWRKAVGPLTLGLFTAGCVASSPGRLAPVLEEHAGEYTRGARGSWFLPCPGSPGDSLWVTFMGPAADDARRRADSGLLLEAPTFVRWRAERVTDGRVGPGGPALLVYEILEARPSAEAGCLGAGAVGEVRPSNREPGLEGLHDD